ncbi:MAG: hypothetical protein ACYCQJ_14700 [Nitrososphaerales archaeon]
MRFVMTFPTITVKRPDLPDLPDRPHLPDLPHLQDPVSIVLVLEHVPVLVAVITSFWWDPQDQLE